MGRKRAARRRLGLCVDCTAPKHAAEGRTRCGYHLELAMERGERRRAKMEQEGRCYCGRPRPAHKKTCDPCSKHDKRRRPLAFVS